MRIHVNVYAIVNVNVKQQKSHININNLPTMND